MKILNEQAIDHRIDNVFHENTSTDEGEVGSSPSLQHSAMLLPNDLFF